MLPLGKILAPELAAGVDLRCKKGGFAPGLAAGVDLRCRKGGFAPGLAAGVDLRCRKGGFAPGNLVKEEGVGLGLVLRKSELLVIGFGLLAIL